MELLAVPASLFFPAASGKKRSLLDEPNLLRLSQVSCDEFRLRAPGVYGPLEPIKSPTQRGAVASDLRREQGHAGPEEPGLHPGNEQGEP